MPLRLNIKKRKNNKSKRLNKSKRFIRDGSVQRFKIGGRRK